jgi:hypothetical protein
MSNVVRFPSTSDPRLFIRQFATDMEVAFSDSDCLHPEKIVIAMKMDDGNWHTGYCNAGFVDRVEAQSHIMVDVIDCVIRANSERYGLHSHD